MRESIFYIAVVIMVITAAVAARGQTPDQDQIDSVVETPEEPTNIRPAPPMACYYDDHWIPCDEVPKPAGEGTIYHEDGQTYKAHYCAAHDTISVLWVLVTGEVFPYPKSVYCGH